jgi:hypothetical protein
LDQLYDPLWAAGVRALGAQVLLWALGARVLLWALGAQVLLWALGARVLLWVLGARVLLVPLGVRVLTRARILVLLRAADSDLLHFQTILDKSLEVHVFVPYFLKLQTV